MEQGQKCSKVKVGLGISETVFQNKTLDNFFINLSVSSLQGMNETSLSSCVDN